MLLRPTGRTEAKDREKLENQETVELAAEVKEGSPDIVQKGTEITEVAELKLLAQAVRAAASVNRQTVLLMNSRQ